MEYSNLTDEHKQREDGDENKEGYDHFAIPGLTHDVTIFILLLACNPKDNDGIAFHIVMAKLRTVCKGFLSIVNNAMYWRLVFPASKALPMPMPASPYMLSDPVEKHHGLNMFGMRAFQLYCLQHGLLRKRTIQGGEAEESKIDLEHIDNYEWISDPSKVTISLCFAMVKAYVVGVNIRVSEKPRTGMFDDEDVVNKKHPMFRRLVHMTEEYLTKAKISRIEAFRTRYITNGNILVVSGSSPIEQGFIATRSATFARINLPSNDMSHTERTYALDYNNAVPTFNNLLYASAALGTVSTSIWLQLRGYIGYGARVVNASKNCFVTNGPQTGVWEIFEYHPTLDAISITTLNLIRDLSKKDYGSAVDIRRRCSVVWTCCEHKDVLHPHKH